MKLMPIILLAAFTGIACCSQDKTQNSDYNIRSGQKIVQEVSQDKFYVIIEIVVYAEQIAKYPLTWSQTQAALAEWESKIPVKFKIYIEDPFTLNPFGFPDQIFHYRPYIQTILMSNLQSPELGAMQEDILGIWQPSIDRLLLDADTLENNANLAFSVALHEVGHMLGVPHVVNFGQHGLTGFIIIPDEIDATEFVMYPEAVDSNTQKTLSNIEIEIAKNYVLYRLTNTDKFITRDCELNGQK